MYQKLPNKSADATSWELRPCTLVLRDTDRNGQCGWVLFVPGIASRGNFAASFYYIDICAGTSSFMCILRPGL